MDDLFLDYDQIAAEYNQRYPSQRPTQRGLALLGLAQQVKAGNILEVGSGTGFWLNLLFRVSKGLYGLDYSAGMIAQAQKQPAPLQLARGTALHLPYQDHSFELVYCVDAIHHFGDPQAFIREAFRVLKPGGALAVIGFDPHEELTNWYIYDYFDGTYETDIRRYPSERAVLNWMRTEGFENVSSQTAEHILNTQVGGVVLQDPFLKHNSTSQLALLSIDRYQTGIQNIQLAIAEAEKRKEQIDFYSDLFIKMYVGYKPENKSRVEFKENQIIGRIWHGYTTPENAEAYEKLLKEEIFTGIQNRHIPGFQEIQLLRRNLGTEVEFVTIMWFDNLESVRAFAGEDYEAAVVPSKARALLSRFDERSQHYEIRERLRGE